MTTLAAIANEYGVDLTTARRRLAAANFAHDHVSADSRLTDADASLIRAAIVPESPRVVGAAVELGHAQEAACTSERADEAAAVALAEAARAADLAADKWLHLAGFTEDEILASEYRNRGGWMRNLAAKHRMTANHVRLGLA